MNRLTNGQITLRALEPDDVDLLYYWENHTDIWRVSNTYAPVSKFILANYIKHGERDIWESKALRLVIETPSGQPVGTVELFDFEPYHQRAGLGVVIFAESDRRKGYATEALTVFLDFIHEQLGLVQVYVNVAADNPASLVLFEKLDFSVIGIKKQWLRRVEGWTDEVMLQKFLF